MDKINNDSCKINNNNEVDLNELNREMEKNKSNKSHESNKGNINNNNINIKTYQDIEIYNTIKCTNCLEGDKDGKGSKNCVIF